MELKNHLTFETAFSQYTATEIIGEGGAGRVYKAHDEAKNTYAIKILNAKNATRERIKRFKNEITFCEQNTHPHILKIIDNGPYKEGNIVLPFYVMQFYDSSLRRLIEAVIEYNAILPLFSQILDGVEAAHKLKAIHRDLKPENILYDSKNKALVVADFGIARFQEEELYTAVETKAADRLANFQYAAPEQRMRGAHVDEQADIYALGLMLNEMFTGVIPLGTSYKLIASVAQEYTYLDDLVSSMLRQSPQDRTSSIEVIKRELIGRKNDFVELQRLSEIRSTVIPSTEIDDPLIIDPPRLIDFDWQNGVLTLILSRPITDKWIQTFYRIDWRQSLMGKEPNTFTFNKTKGEVQVPAEEHQVQGIINHFKPWLPTTNNDYRQLIEQEKKAQEEKMRKELQEKIVKQEARERLKKTIKI
ncbi:MAG: serine/threonine protein kinase [Anaerolineaceae bacterium]|nr:MAG: serine/threonine protein kinase [Anaerolineaceae bacterium]